MTYTALEIAKYIINYCNENNRSISNLKLQKILYYAWVDFFKETGTELYLDEICAWQLGPVVPSVYYEFCSYAGMPIPYEYDVDIKENDKKILNSILREYVDVSASDLVNRSHEHGTPWDLVFQGGIGNRSVIPFDLIKEKECGA